MTALHSGIAKASSVVVLAAALSGCGSQQATEEIGSTRQETRCGGTWDWQDVELYDGFDATFTQEMVARYRGSAVRTPACSGSLVGSDLLLTAAHCKPSVGEFVGFNCQLDINDPTPPDLDAAAAARCDWHEIVESLPVNSGIDVAAYRIAGNPGMTYGWAFPTVSPVENGQTVAILQHPQSPSKVNPDRRKLVAFGPVSSLTATRLSYRVDTSGGSSGSGVLNRAGLTVGVHTADGCTATAGANKAVPMKLVYESVPAVAGLLTAVWNIQL